ncbi:PREDICTED: histone H1-like [Ceratosolen solmsi marchali]|uniref:Histone H1-like n=1 Tax=Ceratosolen solmsi marchali TaxID=326594 RepID=A0AAJ6YXR8_9HYME|nr:PREDICTED: histone H1-like [Ceratosolen solmsi marchali]
MASSPDTNSDIKDESLSDEYEIEVKEVVKSDKQLILSKEAPLKSSAAKVKRAALKRKAKSTRASSIKATLSGSLNLKNKSKILAAAKKERKMPEASKNRLTTKEMIINAIIKLNEKKGSSTVAIRKYLINNYDANQQRLLRITKLLRTAGDEGWLIQTSGAGASAGSYFKLPIEAKKEIIKINKKLVSTKEFTKPKMSAKKVSSKVNKASEATKKKTIVISKRKRD